MGEPGFLRGGKSRGSIQLPLLKLCCKACAAAVTPTNFEVACSQFTPDIFRGEVAKQAANVCCFDIRSGWSRRNI